MLLLQPFHLNSTVILLILASLLNLNSKLVFKFHCDSINIFFQSYHTPDADSFKFHCDSINMPAQQLKHTYRYAFKFHCDSININTLFDNGLTNKNLNSTVILLISTQAIHLLHCSIFKFHCDSINITSCNPSKSNRKNLNSTVILLIL